MSHPSPYNLGAAGDMVCRSTSTVRTFSCLSEVNGGAQFGHDNKRQMTWERVLRRIRALHSRSR